MSSVTTNSKRMTFRGCLSQFLRGRSVRRATLRVQEGTASPAFGCAMAKKIVRMEQMNSSVVSFHIFNVFLLKQIHVPYTDRKRSLLFVSVFSQKYTL